MILLNQTQVYDFSYNDVLFEIEHRYNIYYSYKLQYKNNRQWLENKDSSLKEAIDTCLREIGIPKKERDSIKYQIK